MSAGPALNHLGDQWTSNHSTPPVSGWPAGVRLPELAFDLPRFIIVSPQFALLPALESSEPLAMRPTGSAAADEECTMQFLTTFILGLAALAMAAHPVIARSVPQEPTIPSSGPSVESFVPRGYEIETRIDRDLDGDGKRDAAMLLVPICDASQSPQEVGRCQADGRLLVIVLRRRGFDLSARVPISSDVGPHGDSSSGMTARGRTLRFSGGSSSCAGQNYSLATLSYRYRSGDWFLIGLDDQEWRQTTECGGGPIGTTLCPKLTLRTGEDCIGLDRSIDYSTSTQELRWTIRSITAGGDEKERRVVVRERFAPSPLGRLVERPPGFQ